MSFKVGDTVTFKWIRWEYTGIVIPKIHEVPEDVYFVKFNLKDGRERKVYFPSDSLHRKKIQEETE